MQRAMLRERAYAPYSNFKVGAALRADTGAVFVGCNVENVAYPEGTCAEAGAIAAMIAGGAQRIAEIVVIADSPTPVPPCGGCRQKIAEFAGADVPVTLLSLNGARQKHHGRGTFARRVRRGPYGARLMPRAFLVVLDSVGCGGAPDAEAFGDAGANTLGHIAQACAAGQADKGRAGPLRLAGAGWAGLGGRDPARLWHGCAGSWRAALGPVGCGRQRSRAARTPRRGIGNWRGVPVPWDWTYFPRQIPAFSPDLTAKVCDLAGTHGILGNCHAGGVAIIDRFGAEHLRTGWPICYTSADSVFQIAAHEQAFGLDRLHKLCADLAPHLHAIRVGRVIARALSGHRGRVHPHP